MLVSSLSRHIVCPDIESFYFPQYLHTNTAVMPPIIKDYILPNPFQFMSHPMLYVTTIESAFN
jgi:hypothetical protein